METSVVLRVQNWQHKTCFSVLMLWSSVIPMADWPQLRIIKPQQSPDLRHVNHKIIHYFQSCAIRMMIKFLPKSLFSGYWGGLLVQKSTWDSQSTQQPWRRYCKFFSRNNSGAMPLRVAQCCKAFNLRVVCLPGVTLRGGEEGLTSRGEHDTQGAVTKALLYVAVFKPRCFSK